MWQLDKINSSFLADPERYGRLGQDAFKTGNISEKNCDCFVSTIVGFKNLILVPLNFLYLTFPVGILVVTPAVKAAVKIPIKVLTVVCASVSSV